MTGGEESRVIGYFVPSALEPPPTRWAFTRLVQLLRSHALLVLSIVAVSVALGVAYLLSAQRTYRSETALVIASDKDSAQALGSIGDQFGGIASLIGLDLDLDSGKRDALATLRSKSFLIDFIREQNLLPVLYASRWNEEAQRWDLYWWQSVPSEQDAYERMKERVYRVVDDKTAGLVWIRIDWNDPAVAAQWANALVRRANSHLQREAIEEASRSLKFLEQELNKTTVTELRQAIHRLQETQIRRIMLANVRHEYAFRVIDPAIPSDRDDYVSPRVLLTLSLAVMGGLLIGLLAAFIADRARVKTH